MYGLPGINDYGIVIGHCYVDFVLFYRGGWYWVSDCGSYWYFWREAYTCPSTQVCLDVVHLHFLMSISMMMIWSHIFMPNLTCVWLWLDHLDFFLLGKREQAIRQCNSFLRQPYIVMTDDTAQTNYFIYIIEVTQCCYRHNFVQLTISPVKLFLSRHLFWEIRDPLLLIQCISNM